MIFLPIVERELRVAVRRKGTYRARQWTSAVAVLLCLSMFMNFDGSAARIGPAVYGVLTYYAFGLSLLAGVFLTADCISSEKRQGTLGFLFLTDLNGYDVVLGKLVANGMTAFCGLVAVLPLTGMPLLTGGVTNGEFWRVSLALMNTIFFSLATGILISSWSRDAANAMFGTLSILGIAVVGIPVIGSLIHFTRLPAATWNYISFSPYYPFSYGFASNFFGGAGRYWISLGTSHLVAWIFLLVAGWTLPRAWQDKPLRQVAVPMRKDVPLPVGTMAQRSELLDKNPVFWLAGKDAGSMRHWLMGAVLFCVAASILVLVITDHDVTSIGFASLFLIISSLALKLCLAFEAPRFFVNARRDGALEMLVSTPLTTGQILSGQWEALKRIVLWPCILIFAMQLVLIVGFSNKSPTWGMPLGMPMQMGTAILNLGSTKFNTMGVFSAAWEAAHWVGDILALGWMGMWLGLTAKRPALAGVMNLLLVLALPKILFCVPGPLIDLCFVMWARGRLQTQFRRIVLPEYLPR